MPIILAFIVSTIFILVLNYYNSNSVTSYDEREYEIKIVEVD